jgi:hypothetical protein
MIGGLELKLKCIPSLMSISLPMIRGYLVGDLVDVESTFKVNRIGSCRRNCGSWNWRVIAFDVVKVPALVCQVLLPVGSGTQYLRRHSGREFSTRILVDVPVSKRERNGFFSSVAIDRHTKHNTSGVKSSALSETLSSNSTILKRFLWVFDGSDYITILYWMGWVSHCIFLFHLYFILNSSRKKLKNQSLNP